jgi:hypothetical protein
MEHADASPDQVAKIVFWTIAFFATGFVVGVLILIR